MSKLNMLDGTLYKPCRKKQYEIYMCIPPIGTVVINKFEQADALEILKKYVTILRSREWLTPKEMNKVKERSIHVYNYIIENCSIVSKKYNCVLCGTEGELWVTSLDSVKDKYLMFSNNSYVSIDSVITSRLNGSSYMHWFRVRTKQQASDSFAVHIPYTQKGYLVTKGGVKLWYNDQRCQHGKGDFILCDSINGKPNLNALRIVNGFVFSNTYDNRGWEKVISIKAMNSVIPDELFSDEDIVSAVTVVNKDLSKEFYNNLLKYLSSTDTVEGTLTSTLVSKTITIKNKHTNECCLFVIAVVKDKVACSFLINGIKRFSQGYPLNELGEKNIYNILVTKIGSDELWQMFINTHSYFDKIKLYIDKNKSKEGCGLSQLSSTLEKARGKLDKDFCESAFYFIQALIDCSDYCNVDFSEIDEDCISSDDLSFKFQAILRNVRNKYEHVDSITFCLNYTSPQFVDSYGWNNIPNSGFNYDDGDNLYEASFKIGSYKDYYSECIDKSIRKLNTAGDPHYKDTKVVPKTKSSTDNLSYYLTENELYMQYKGMHFYSNLENKDISLAFNLINKLFKDKITISEDLLSKNTSTSYSNIGDFYDLVQSFLGDLDLTKSAYSMQDEKDGLNNHTNTSKLILSKIFIRRIDEYTGYAYISINKWGTDDMDFYCVSSSTLRILKANFSYKIVELNDNYKANYKRIHYHDLVVKTGDFFYLREFKKLKLKFLDYCDAIFPEIDKSLLICVGNYYDGSNFESLNGYSAFFLVFKWGDASPFICINASNFNLENALSKNVELTLLHEICHAYTYYKYGDVKEEEGKDGGTIYNIPEKYKEQWLTHGEHFGTAVNLASNYTGFSFGDIFAYEKNEYSTPESARTRLVYKNAFNVGQPYRKVHLSQHVGYFCNSCGSISDVPICDKCGSLEVSEFSNKRYVAICENCGKTVAMSDEDFNIDGLNSDYLDVIDRIGYLDSKSCSCGGSLKAVYKDDGSNKSSVSKYLKDYNYSQRLKELMLSIMNSELPRYSPYFKKKMDCDISVEGLEMPAIRVSLRGDCFSENYLLFIVTANEKVRVNMYRDYGLQYKGYKIHSFRVKNNHDMSILFRYMMTYLRKDVKTI